VQDDAGHVVTSVTGVGSGRALSVRVVDGRIHATTTSTELLERPAEPAETDPDPEDTDA